MKILFYFSFSILISTHSLSQNSFGLSGAACFSKYDYGEFIEGKMFLHSITCVSETANVAIKEKGRVKNKAKDSFKNKIKRLVKRNKSDTAEKPDSFWTTVGLGLGFSILMLLFNAPLIILFFVIISGFGLGGYYIFRKKHKIIAEIFLMLSTALHLGIGLFALYAIYLESVID